MMGEDYDLKQSVRSIKHLYPVLLAKDMTIIDGKHRLKEDNDWPRLKLDHIDTLKKVRIAQLASNFQRRRMPIKELRFILNSLAGEYRSEGQQGSLTETIARDTGVNVRTVSRYLKGEYKDLSHAVREPDLKTQDFKSDKQPYLSSTDWDCSHCHKHMAVLCNGRRHKVQVI